MAKPKGNQGKGKKAARKAERRVESRRGNSDEDLGHEFESETELVVPEQLPVLPAKDLVAFPSVMMSFYVGRTASLKAIQNAMAGENLLFVVTQKDSTIENPEGNDLYKTGVVAHIVRSVQIESDRYKVLIQGLLRAKVNNFTEGKNFLTASVEPLQPLEAERSKDLNQLLHRVRAGLQTFVNLQDLPDDLMMIIDEVDDPGTLADLVLAHVKPGVGIAQSALEELDPVKRLRLVDSLITEDLRKLMVHEQIRDKAETEMTKGQREFYLREQLRQIKQELGEGEESNQDLQELREKLVEKKLPETVSREVFKQLKRLESMNQEAADASLIRTYLEWMVDLPWNSLTKDRIDLKLTKEILDTDHYGLEKVKDRIIEFLSVRKLNKDSQGPILCLVGPPGVGKTSLGRSIAKSLQRSFFRMSLGGVRDEAEIRGHRRTYVGALPGRIIQGMKQAATSNPVFVLDELDKVGADFRGDPAAALLEVLDPQQNKEFVDHYLNVPYDLSNVMFVATANTTDTIPEALTDRLEVIRIPGYTTQEKLRICERYLVPKQRKENGLEQISLTFKEEALEFLIDRYTREAGVRNLDREIASLCRKIAREVAEGSEKGSRKRKKKSYTVNPDLVAKLLGATKFDPDDFQREDAIGYVVGLAWTIYGGEILPLEVSTAVGKGQLLLTGHLGQVMQESAQAALFFTRANARELGLDPEFYSKLDVHVHAPAGATPKDGPSAGIAITTALVSALSKRKVSTSLAMTGEVTLRGNVLPVGGVKEKALAALRYGIHRIIIPAENLKDIEEIPVELRKTLEFIPVKHVSEVLKIALVDEDGPKAARGNSKRRRGPPVTLTQTV
jgi:ATP-dependent Lon protease